MKKKSPKTAARKPAASRRADWMDFVDALNEHCKHIAALAMLLEEVGVQGAEPLRPDMVGNAAGLIVREADQIRGWMERMQGEEIKP